MNQENPYAPPGSAVQDSAPEPAVALPAEILKKIRNAWMAALLSGAITLVFVLLALAGNPMLGFSAWELLDVGLILGLAFGIYRKSRTCAILMLVYFIAAKAVLVTQGAKPSTIPMSLVFIYFYWQGVVGTFAYHAFKKRPLNPASGS